MSYATHVSKRITPQSQPIPGSDQVKNSAGGFTWTVDCWTRLDRFLILGSEKGSYYASERELTVANADCILECAKQDAARAVNRIVEISHEGRAPKNDPAVFALALIAGGFPEDGQRLASKLALDALPKVCRIGTHLFQFIETLKARRGFGRSVRDALAAWYTSKTPEAVAKQVTKYQQRNGWSHRDVLRLCHAKAESHNAVFKYVAQPEKFREENLASTEGLQHLLAVEHAKTADEKEIVRLIQEHDLPRECIPTQHLNSVKVWDALLQEMPPTAMIRNLGKMSAIGLVAPLSNAAKFVVERLGDVERLKKSRVHPMACLIAQKIYAQGHGDKGSLQWVKVPQVVDALETAFYASFAAVQPTGKRWMLGIDVSASMGSPIAGSPLSCCEAATALALVTSAVEPWTFTGRFNQGFQQVPFTNKTRLDDALRYTNSINDGGTDCSLPMVYALENKIPVDAFVVLTDNETWAGKIHPSQALQQYRQKMGINAKLIVNGMVANQFTIADPNDGGMLDVVGFDTTVPQVMAEFAKG